MREAVHTNKEYLFFGKMIILGKKDGITAEKRVEAGCVYRYILYISWDYAKT